MLVVRGDGFPVLAIAALAGTDESNAGLGSALLSASQQLGGALGLAVFVHIATRSAGSATRSSMRSPPASQKRSSASARFSS
jgi:hypothetical protein